MISWWNKIDSSQKMVLLIGLSLVGAVGYYYVSIYDKQPDKKGNTQDYKVETIVDEDLAKKEKDMLATIREKNKYDRDKAKEKSRYGINDLDDEFAIKEKQSEDTVKEVEQVVEKSEPEKPKVIVKYVEKPVAAAPPEPVKQEVKSNERVGKVRGGFATSATAGTTTTTKTTTENTDKIARAVVHNTQTVRSGDPIELRLTSPFKFNDVVIPANSFITGVAKVGSNRMDIEIKSFRYNNQIYMTSMLAFDQDGIQGLNIPEGNSREVKKDIINSAVNRASRSVGVGEVGSISRTATDAQLSSRLVEIPDGYRVDLLIVK